MEDYLLSAVHLLLVTPCLLIGVYFYRKQRDELDAQQQIFQRLAIAWCVMIFVIVSLSIDHLWATYVVTS